MAITADRARIIDEKIDILQSKLNMPPLGKYTIPDNIKQRLDEDCLSRENVLMLVNSMMSHMRLPFEAIDLNITIDRSADRNIRYKPMGEYVFYGVPGRNQINLCLTEEDTAETVAALLSHEMSHHHLYHKWIRIEPDGDNEILTDVGAVYFGFAVYMLERYSDSLVTHVSFFDLMSMRNKPSKMGYIDKEQIRYAMRRCDELRRTAREKK